MREAGFYWVKEFNLGWIVCQYFNDESWQIPGLQWDYSDKDFLQIDEQRIIRLPENVDEFYKD